MIIKFCHEEYLDKPGVFLKYCAVLFLTDFRICRGGKSAYACDRAL